jgi:hypothetical protein
MPNLINTPDCDQIRGQALLKGSGFFRSWRRVCL